MSSGEINVKKLLKEAKTYLVDSKKNDPEDLNRAIRLLKKVIKSDAKNFWAYIYYGCAAQRLEGKENEAVKAFDVASKINPNTTEAWKGFTSLSEVLTKTGDRSKLLIAYSNLLRLEVDDKWNNLFEEAKKHFSKPHEIVALLSLCVDNDPLSNVHKHRLSCRIISVSVFDDPTVYQKQADIIHVAFKGYSRSLDFYDRPLFCLKALQFLMKTKNYPAATDFLAYTIKCYGAQTYKTIHLVDVIIEISLDSLEIARDLVNLIGGRVKEHCSKNFNLPHSKLALSIVCWFESDYLLAREILELRCFSGDRAASMLLLKFLTYVMDFEGIIFLFTRLKWLFTSEGTENQKKVEMLMHLIRALCCSNEVKCLELSLKLGIKLKKSFRLQPNELSQLFYCLTHACVGLQKEKMYYYLRKLYPLCANKEQILYLIALIEGDPRTVSPDSPLWANNLMLEVSSGLIRGDISHVAKHCKILATVEKRLPDPYVLLGLVCESRDQVNNAYSCYDKALSLRTHDCYILWIASNLLLRLGNVEEALELMKSTALGLFGKWHPTAERACKVAGLIHSIRNENSEALDRFRQAYKISSNSREYLEYIADTYIQMRMLNSAENYYMRLISDEVNDLHSMLSLTFTVKLSLNFSSYFNNSVKCINCIPSPNANLRDYENFLSFILCNFVNVYSNESFRQLPQKLRFHFDSNLKKLCTKELLKVKQLYAQSEMTRKLDNGKPCEYLISIYCYLESHLIAAVKFQKRRDIEMANKLFQFCTDGIIRAFSVYGMKHVSFWKLLGDVFLNSSASKKCLKVPQFLNPENDVFPGVIDASGSTLINSELQLLAAVKCYAIAIKILPADSPRIYEMYYDISISFFRLSLSCLNPRCKYHCLKESLKAVLEAFRLYPLEDDVWIFFNLIGAITSVLGMKKYFYSDMLSKRRRPEEIFLNNKATWLLKADNIEEAFKVYETVRIDTNAAYSSPWVGQLVIMLHKNDDETRKRLLFLMRYLGSHPLLQWLFAFYIFQNQKRLSSEFQKGLSDFIKRIFGKVKEENSPGRLTILGYMHEISGDKYAAYRAYVSALQAAKYVSDDATLDILLRNVARVSKNCQLAAELIEMIVDDDSKTLALLQLHSLHISNKLVEPKVLNGLLFCLKKNISNDIGNLSSLPRVVSLLLHLLRRKNTNLNTSLTSSVVQSDLSAFCYFSRKTVRKILFSLPSSKLISLMRLIENLFYSYNLLKGNSPNVKLMVPDNGAILGGKNIQLTHLDDKQRKMTVSCERNESASSSSTEISNLPIPSRQHSSNVAKVRKMFPLPLSSGANFNQRRENVKAFQAMKEKSLKPKPDASFSLLTPPLKCGLAASDQQPEKEIYESHGCHSVCRNLLSLLYKSLKDKDLSAATKLCFICLDSKCTKCVSSKELSSVVVYLAASLKNCKLLQKALHLYPDNTVLWKCLVIFSTVR